MKPLKTTPAALKYTHYWVNPNQKSELKVSLCGGYAHFANTHWAEVTCEECHRVHESLLAREKSFIKGIGA